MWPFKRSKGSPSSSSSSLSDVGAPGSTPYLHFSHSGSSDESVEKRLPSPKPSPPISPSNPPPIVTVPSSESQNSEKSYHRRPFEISPTNEPTYDSSGIRIPYISGPYLISQNSNKKAELTEWSDNVGCSPGGLCTFYPIRGEHKKVTKWYGRMEDGYMVWSSIYLFEWFGFKYYEPLPPNVGGKLAKIPPWLPDLYSLPNLAIAMSYFCVGVALQLLRTPLIVYLIEDKGASPAEVNVLFTVMAVPWCFKVLYGFLSDCVPINGERRKPYLMLGWFIYLITNLILAAIGEPSISAVIFLVFIMTSAYMLADVMTDALIVERSTYETRKGDLQSRGYIIRFFGSTCGAALGAVVYNKNDWSFYLPISMIFLLNGLFILVFLLPFIPYLVELSDDCKPKAFKKQCSDLFETVQLRAVWQPMTFVYVFNAMQIANAAWMSFLVEGLGFKAWEIGVLGTVASLMTWFGIIAYEKYLFESSWRIVFVVCSSINVIIGLLQLALVSGKSREWGIPDLLFALGDDGVQEFLIGIQFLPLCLMYLSMCPAGSEGTTYAMLTTFSNLAGTVAFDISTVLTMVWDVEEETIDAGDFTGVFNLSLLCTVVAPLPLIFIGLIPRNRSHQDKLIAETTRSPTCGIIFISVMILTMLGTFYESIHTVRHSGDVYEEYRRLLTWGD
ncbi:hypothetical protein TrST_g10738 [Triparma strigata]|uniref:Uncharacterized protein n=1 Tax=Triparma strigata TaxID=1606541 RepID=A0A9W7EXF8_9STRA|nr:hypothetical protein TrST_g10738 [Triparma strigata]